MIVLECDKLETVRNKMIQYKSRQRYGTSVWGDVTYDMISELIAHKCCNAEVHIMSESGK